MTNFARHWKLIFLALSIWIGSPWVQASTEEELKRSFVQSCLPDARISETLKGASFASDPFSVEKLSALKGGDVDPWSITVLGSSASTIERELSVFQFQGKGSSNPILLQPEVTQEILPYNQLQLNLSGSFHKVDWDRPVGFFVLTFENTMEPLKQNRHPYLDFIKLDTADPATRGMGTYFTEYIGQFLKSKGYPALFLEADWAGRGFWAKVGFDFDAAYVFKVNGQTRTQLEVARENLQRFVEYHGFTLNDLALRGPPETPITGLDQLKRADDFLNVVLTGNRKVKVKPYLDEDVLSPEVEMDLGSAFMQQDYRPRPDQSLKIEAYDDDFVSDIAMPYWKGRKNF